MDSTYKIDPKGTYVVINTKGLEVKVPGSMVEKTMKQGALVIAEYVDGVRVELEEPLSNRPIVRSMFSPGWNKEEKTEEEKTTAQEAYDDPDRHICISCGFEAQNKGGLIAHQRVHRN